MKTISLKFTDILYLLEFIELTHNHQCSIDEEKIILRCELPDADIELAINGYGAALMKEADSG